MATEKNVNKDVLDVYRQLGIEYGRDVSGISKNTKLLDDLRFRKPARREAAPELTQLLAVHGARRVTREKAQGFVTVGDAQKYCWDRIANTLEK